MPEWSKGCDSSSYGFDRVGSNPTQHIFFVNIIHIIYIIYIIFINHINKKQQ